MAETIPKWSAEDERLLEELTERKQQRAYQLTKRVIDVASEIHIHNMSEDEIADGMIQRANEVCRVLRPFIKGPFKAMVIPVGTVLGGGLEADRQFIHISLKEWSPKAILDALDADGWVPRESFDKITPDEVDTHGNPLRFSETLRMYMNVATVRYAHAEAGHLMIVRIPEGEGEY